MNDQNTWMSALFKKISFYIDDQLVETIKYCDKCQKQYVGQEPFEESTCCCKNRQVTPLLSSGHIYKK